MFKLAAAFLIFVFFAAGNGPSAFAAKRLALVIGNSNYKLISPLTNPKNDAELMAATLEDVGFEVITAIDANRRDMSRAVKKFGKKLRLAGKDAVGLFFYAGHGVQASGSNFLIPIGAEIEDQSDLTLETLSASDILSQMESAGNALNLVILDACRNNPFKGRVRAASRGLARINAASGSLVAFAAAPGQVAADGTGKNSPYTKALTAAMKKPGLAIEQVFKLTRLGVEKQTNGQQTPWEESSLKGDFSFLPSEKIAKANVAPVRQSARAATSPGQIAALEVAYWNSIQSSNNAEVFEAYLKRFPKGTFTELATIKLNRLKSKVAKLSPPEQPRSAVVEQAPERQTNTGGLFANRRELVSAIQSELNRHRCNAGRVDGAWGLKSTRAVARFAKYANLSLTPDPSDDLYNSLKGRKQQACPLTCGSRYEIKNNACKLKTCTNDKVLSQSGKCINSITGFDGAYQVSAIRTVNQKLACLPTYNMDLVVTNGKAKHKIFFGPWLNARVKNGSLHMSSAPTDSGGRWVGIFRLSNSRGKNTSGVFKWAGDSKKCEYKVSIVKR